MLLQEINNYLKKNSEKSVFKINIEENGGYLKFSNSGQRGDRKFFTIGLNAINNMLKDIKNNISEFQKYTNYIEQNWRDLSTYYTDETIKSIATVQTKPLFVTISKLINWANDNKESNENIIDLSEKSLENTINKLENLLVYFTPNYNENIEELFKKWLKNNVDTSAPISTYPLALKEKIPKHLNSRGEMKYKSLFECRDVSYLQTLYKRLLKGGDLYDFNISTQSRLPSASVGKYIDFLYENINTGELQNIENYNTFNKTKEAKEQFTNKALGKLDFPHKNLLLKGVPGTGKSKTIDNIIEHDLDMNAIRDNVLRINIHSASSNSDLMQGISISTDDKSNILYQEKRGAVLKHIFKAMFKPKQPFVLVLEEIQENSLNELIGDLIYLIEKDKRTEIKLEDDQELSYAELFTKVNPTHFVELPNLVEGSESNIKMIMPDNLYVFCTSNYRDDKKVIEDNLLRRFDVVEIYPKTQETLGETVFKSKEVSDFLDKLNGEILKKFKDETHPDRYMVGHANWLNINDEDTEENKKLFYTALLKVLVEFKEIREVDFDTYAKEIVQSVCKNEALPDRLKAYIDACDFKYDSYKEMVEKLQKEIYRFLK